MVAILSAGYETQYIILENCFGDLNHTDCPYSVNGSKGIKQSIDDNEADLDKLGKMNYIIWKYFS